MNQDQVKTKLLVIRAVETDFSVIFSGKSSKRVNGLYKPESYEIIIHNRNFSSDNDLMYTAIHEYAHHIQHASSPFPLGSRTHNSSFWSLHHALLDEAEKQGIYSSPFEVHPEFVTLTRRIKEEFVTVNGDLMKKLGGLFKEADNLCEKHQVRFTDYLDRVLAFPRTSAKQMIKAHEFELDPRVGFENMRMLTRIRDPESRLQAQEAFLEGESPDTVRQKFAAKQTPPDPMEMLTQEKARLQNQIQRLQNRLKEVTNRIEQARSASGRRRPTRLTGSPE